MITIITPVSIKDVFTYALCSKIYKHSNIEVNVICGFFTEFILKNIFLMNWVNYYSENELLKSFGGRNSIHCFVSKNNPKINKKLNWYIQQILKYSLVLKLRKDAIIIDGDTFPVCICDIFNLSNIRFLNRYSPIHNPYEETISNLFGRKLNLNDNNYVCEVFSIKFIQLEKMLSEIETNTRMPWNKAILSLSSDLIGFSEYQTYGRYEELSNHIRYEAFPTLRTYGNLRTPFQKIIVDENIKFITIESYHKVKGLHGCLYLPLQIIGKIFYKLMLK